MDELKTKKSKAMKKLKAELKSDPDKFIYYVLNIKKEIAKLRKDLVVHIKEPYGEILVKEKDGSWGAWTGMFRTNEIKKIAALKEQITEHFDFHFKSYTRERVLACY